jgi:hypothetical protein
VELLCIINLFAIRFKACSFCGETRSRAQRCGEAFLQGHFAIIRGPCCQWSMDVITDIMFACCILHNMILEDKCNVLGLDDIFGNREGDI